MVDYLRVSHTNAITLNKLLTLKKKALIPGRVVLSLTTKQIKETTFQLIVW